MSFDERQQSRLNLEALNDAERLTPSVDLFAGNDSMLRFRQVTADPVEYAPQHLIGAGLRMDEEIMGQNDMFNRRFDAFAVEQDMSDLAEQLRLAGEKAHRVETRRHGRDTVQRNS